MKNAITLLLFLSGLLSLAQKTGDGPLGIPYKNATCRSSFSKIILTGEVNERTLLSFLKQHCPNLKDYRTGLKFNYKKESPGGFHYSFTQVFEGVEVYQSEVKVNLDRQNTIHSLFDNSENTASWNLNITGAGDNQVIALRADNGLPVLCTRRIADNSRELLEAGGELIFERDMNVYFTDSMVSGKIFNPDPLTTAQQPYQSGTSYADNGNATNPLLDAQLQTVSFRARFDAGVFSLESPYVKMSDFDGPNVAVPTSNDGQFYFDRSQSGFEDVNAFYHISTIQNHIHSLGFTSADGFVEVDAHAVGGQDQSYFSPGSWPQKIYFGEGYVDDAEDADVVVHEYAHFVSESSAPGTNNGLQRQSLDEGFGDYMAGSYSRSLSQYADNWVFNWDGHNEFWNGRILNSTKVYPTDLSNSYYQNGQIWSTALYCVNGTIGRAATDSLILQTHYAYSQNISLADAAQLLLDADTLLTNGKYSCDIYNCLLQRGLQPQNPLTNCAVGLPDTENFPLRFINNGSAFSLLNPGSEPVQLQIWGVQGQLVYAIDENQSVFNYSNHTFAPGVYLVNVRINGFARTFKWVKAGL